MVIDARPGSDRTRLGPPARSVLARRAGGDDNAFGGPGDDPAEATADAVAVADAAARLAARIATNPGCKADVAACGGVDLVADQLMPIVVWAFEVPGLADVDAVRVGVTVARMRLLLGTPLRIVLAAVHELPAVLLGASPSPGRLDELAIEVGLRVRRQRDLPDDLSLA